MSEWQAMSTAPKNGTQIIVWDGENMAIAKFTCFSDGSARWTTCDDGNGNYGAILRILTHWMPLPAPPESK